MADRHGFRALLVSLLGVALVAGGCVPAGPDRTTGVVASPPPPTDLEVVDVSTDRVDLRWADGGEGAEITASEYRVYRDGERVAGVDSAFHSDTGLQPSTEYEYRVSAVDEVGTESDPSSPVFATTDTRQQDEEEDDEEEDQKEGDQEEGDQEEDDQEENDQEEDDQEQDDQEDQEEDQEDEEEGDGQDDGQDGEDDGDDGNDDDGGEDDQEDDDGEDDQQDEEDDDGEDDEEDDSPPSRPTQLQAKAVSATRIDLSWEAAEDPESGIEEYVIYRQRHKAKGDGEEREAIDTTGSLTYSDTGLQQDTEYEYWVSAVNGAGLEGEKSDSAKERTKKKKDEK